MLWCVSQLQELLVADAGQAQNFDGGERPERFLSLEGQVSPPPSAGFLGQTRWPAALVVTARRSDPSVPGITALGSVA
jgi:hypothetical protein